MSETHVILSSIFFLVKVLVFCKLSYFSIFFFNFFLIFNFFKEVR
jgi:hypothetical protein